MGFYGDDHPAESLPMDAIDITDDVYRSCQHKLGDPPRVLVVGPDGQPALVDVVAAAGSHEEALAAAEANRLAAYRAEADPLFFKHMRGEATRDEWLAKIDEIKARYPDPTA